MAFKLVFSIGTLEQYKIDIRSELSKIVRREN